MTKTKLDWKLISLLSLVGAAMGALTLTGFLTPLGEFGAWTVLAFAIWIPATLRYAPTRPLVTLTLAGTVAGVWTGAIQAAFAETLLANNAAYAASTPDGATPAVVGFLLASAIGTGLVWGALNGGIAWGIRKLRTRGEAADEASA